MRSDTLYTANKYNQAAFRGLLDSDIQEKEEDVFSSFSEPSSVGKKRNDDRLHTVNKYNKKKFTPALVDRDNQNIYDGFGTSFMNAVGDLKGAFNFKKDGGLGGALGTAVGNILGTNGNNAEGAGGGAADSIASATSGGGDSGGGGGILGGLSGGISGIGSAVGGAIGGLISNGYESGVGNVMNTVGKIASVIPGPWGAAISGGLQILGGGVNALFGTKVDQAKLQAANKGTAEYNNFVSNAGSFDDIKMATAQAGVQDAYSSGAFRKGWAEERNKELHQRRIDARQFASRSVANNISNLTADQLNEALANFSALGGKIAKRSSLNKKNR